jgi:4-coumarate--CoA ligase
VDPLTTRQYTFLDVKNTAIAFGQALRTKWNWQKGDVIGVFSANCIDTPPLTFGALWANGVVSPANPAYNASELGFQLSDSGAKALLTQAQSLKTAFEAAKIAGIPQDRILVIGDARDEHVGHFTDFIKSATHNQETRRIQTASDLAFIPYSSGTTGLPKGAMITQRNIVSNLLMVNQTQYEITWNGGPEGQGDALIAVLPFYHVYGKSASFIPLGPLY